LVVANELDDGEREESKLNFPVSPVDDAGQEARALVALIFGLARYEIQEDTESVFATLEGEEVPALLKLLEHFINFHGLIMLVGESDLCSKHSKLMGFGKRSYTQVVSHVDASGIPVWRRSTARRILQNCF
jgi:hypothetical protein